MIFYVILFFFLSSSSFPSGPYGFSGLLFPFPFPFLQQTCVDKLKYIEKRRLERVCQSISEDGFLIDFEWFWMTPILTGCECGGSEDTSRGAAFWMFLEDVWWRRWQLISMKWIEMKQGGWQTLLSWIIPVAHLGLSFCARGLWSRRGIWVRSLPGSGSYAGHCSGGNTGLRDHVEKSWLQWLQRFHSCSGLGHEGWILLSSWKPVPKISNCF